MVTGMLTLAYTTGIMGESLALVSLDYSLLSC